MNQASRSAKGFLVHEIASLEFSISSYAKALVGAAGNTHREGSGGCCHHCGSTLAGELLCKTAVEVLYMRPGGVKWSREMHGNMAFSAERKLI